MLNNIGREEKKKKMYILKNALKNISRSLARNILIGIIVTVIAAASCVALSVRKASEKARESNMENLNITAHINVDRAYLMETIQNSGVDMSDRSAMQEVLQDATQLTLDQLQEYAESEYVSDFYYTSALIVNGVEGELEPLDSDYSSAGDATEAETTEEATEESTEDTTEAQLGPNGETPPEAPDGQGGDGMQGGPEGGGMQQQEQDPLTMLASRSDFMITGYSSDAAMEDFVNGVSTMKEGAMFEEGTDEYQCVISSELATYNSIEVGDTIKVVNPIDEEEEYELEVVGIYKNSESSTTESSSTANDPANNILTSISVIDSMVAASEENQEEEDNRLNASTTGTFVFKDMDGYDNFESYITDKEGGKYVLTSSDVAQYEASLVPLENLKTYATAFLWIILGIGAVVLIVLNMFNIHERKYEVGVLTAIGMHKSKVAWQFILEIFIVTIIAILIGTGIGAATSVPITNQLLASQVAQEEASAAEQQSNFGRAGGQQSSGTFSKGGDVEGPITYVDSVTYAVDGIVVLQMGGIGMGLSIISSLIAIIFIMRYQPLKILTERD